MKKRARVARSRTDDDVHALDVDAAAHQVGGHQYALVALLEGAVAREPLLLRHARVDADGREVALNQQLVQLRCAVDGLHEDDHLVEIQRVEQVRQLAVLLVLRQLDVVLHEPVQCQLRLIVHVDFHRIRHELLADRADVLGQGGREHHHLLVVRRLLEDLLDVGAHVCSKAAAIGRARQPLRARGGVGEGGCAGAPSASSILSHSSSTKWRTDLRIKSPSFASWSTRCV